jgi:DNA-binding response OmpR family regulator
LACDGKIAALNDARRLGASSQEDVMNPKRAARIFLVEDERLLRTLIAQFLRSEGHEVVEAGDGAEGVELYATRGPFDVILLDLNLPILCGVEVCRRIKAQNPAQSVIICSAAILDDHLAALADLQVDQFLTKPYHPRDLLERVAIELARASGSDGGAGDRSCRPQLTRMEPAHRPVPPPAHTLVKAPIID